MNEFKKSSVVNNHYHIFYINYDAKVGECSFDEGHKHEIIYTPKQEAQVDEQGNPISEEIPESWQVSPDPIDGHTHTIENYVPNRKQKSEKEEDVIADIKTLLQTGLSIERESREKGKESEDFVAGKQWSDQAKQYLEGQDRACLVINYIGKHIDDLSGYQREQRTDLRYSPVEAGDQVACDIFNLVAKNIMDNCYFEREEAKVFEDQIVTGRGVFNMYPDFNSDLRGDIKIERFNTWDVFFGPHEKEDLSDCEWVIKHKMFSKAKIKQIAPDLAEDIEEDFVNYLTAVESETIDNPDDQYETGARLPVDMEGLRLVDIAKKEIRIVECWRKVFTKGTVLAVPGDEFYFQANDWDAKDIARVKTIEGAAAFEMPIAQMRITKVAGNTVLSDEYPANLPANDFFVVPVYAKKRGNSFWGKVELGKDAQKEINKRHSQAVDIGNTMIAYKYFYDDTTFPDSAEATRFKKNVTTPGAVTKVNSTDRLPVKWEGIKFPSELVNLLEVSHDGLSQLMSVVPGPGGANESGSAILQKQKMKLTGNEYLFDNFSFAKKKVGRLLIAMIQRYWTPQRVYRLLVNVNTKTPISLGGQPFENFDEEEIARVLRDTDIAKFDVSVTESTYSPTTRLGTFMLLSDLAGKGIPIPPTSLIELLDIPQSEKDKLLQQIQAQSDAQAGAQNSGQKAEIVKTLVAKGTYTPEMLQEFGINLPPQDGNLPPDPNQQAQSVVEQPNQTDQATNLTGF